MNQDYRDPEYFTFPLLAKKLGITQMRIEIDLKTGKISKFMVENLHTKSSPNTLKRLNRLLPILNQYARDNLTNGPSSILCPYGLKSVEIGKKKLKDLIENIESDVIFELWLREYGININNIKIVIPRDEVIRYENYLKDITDEVTASNTGFDINKYFTQIRIDKGCTDKSCYKCDNAKCRSKLAYETANKYGEHTPYRVRLCDIGVAMGCPKPSLAKNKEDKDQMILYTRKKNRVKSQVRRWKAAHRE